MLIHVICLNRKKFFFSQVYIITIIYYYIIHNKEVLSLSLSSLGGHCNLFNIYYYMKEYKHMYNNKYFDFFFFSPRGLQRNGVSAGVYISDLFPSIQEIPVNFPFLLRNLYNNAKSIALLETRIWARLEPIPLRS